MIRGRAGRRSRTRRGTAVVAALALVTLGAALLATSSAVATAGARAVASERAALVADAAARRTLALTLGSWDPRADSLAIGAVLRDSLPPDVVASARPFPISGVRAAQRLGRTLFALSADVRVGSSSWLARRRVRLLVQRRASTDSATLLAPLVPLGRWSTAELY